MKTKWTAVAGIAALLLGAGSALGENKYGEAVTFTGTELPQENPLASLADRGVIQCLGAGKPMPADQDWPPFCPAGTRTLVRSRVLLMNWMTSDPNTTGLIHYYMNLNVDTDTYTGPWWGTFVLEITGKGFWEGTFTCRSEGTRPDGVAAEAPCRLIGKGHGDLPSHLMAEVDYLFFVRPATITGTYLPSPDE